VVTTSATAGGPDAQRPDGAAPLPGGVSRWMDLDGPLHYRDFGGPPGAPLIVCVHGLGGSAANWAAIAPLLAGRYRVLAPDLAGHGLTQSAGRGTGVRANRALLARFIESVSPGPVILMGNSMGGMIALLEAASAPAAVAGLILLDPALPFWPARPDPVVAAIFTLSAVPGFGRVMLARRRRESPELLVARMLALCCADVSRVAADIVALHVGVARQRAGFDNLDRDLLAAVRSVVSTIGYGRGQAYRRVLRSVTCPVLLLHGAADRLVPVAAARAAARANPGWSLVVLPGVGHVPQLEVPGEVAGIITEWLATAGRRAAESATPRS
jgi:pimeloyl-ACP methyl ester carboxylesterase